MLNPLQVKLIYNQRSQKYDKAMKLCRYNLMLQQVIKSSSLVLPKNSKVLDLGCGTGLSTQALIRNFPGINPTGLDYSEEMLKIYQDKFPDSLTIIGDFNKKSSFLSFPNLKSYKMKRNSFDLIISAGAASEYGNPKKVISLAYDLLKPKGIFLNIGVNHNILSPLSIPRKIWKYKQTGKRKFIQTCKITGFQAIEKIKIPLNLFPTNYRNFAMKAIK